MLGVGLAYNFEASRPQKRLMRVSALWKTHRQKVSGRTNKNGALGTYFCHLPCEVSPAAAAHCSRPSCNEFIVFKKKAKKKRRKVLQVTIPPSVSVSSYLNDAIPSLYVHLRSFKNAIAKFCGVYNVPRYCYYSSPEVTFRQNDFRV